MGEHTEVKSENARNVILSYKDTVYYVNQVNVKLQDGADRVKATFHGRRCADNKPQDLDVEISHSAYDALLEYAKLDKLDLVLVLQIEGTEAKWCLMDENWLKKQVYSVYQPFYIV